MRIIRILAGCFFAAAIVGIVGLSVGMDYGNMSQQNITASGTITGATAHITGATTLDSQVTITGTTLTDTPSAAHGNVTQPFLIAKDHNNNIISEMRAQQTSLLVALGRGAGESSFGLLNTFVGWGSGYSARGVGYTTAIGAQANYNACSTETATPFQNTFVGRASGYGNADASLNVGTKNTAIGDSSMFSYTTASENVSAGVNSMVSTTTGKQNVCLGVNSLYSGTGCDLNVVIGYNAGRYYGNSGSVTAMTDVDSSIYIGHNSHGSAATGVTNEIAIGANSVGNGSNTTTLGNSSTTNTYIPYGGLAVDSPTFVVDAANNRVGIGTAQASPTATGSLDVHGYTCLGDGAPAVKIKKLTGTTASSEGGLSEVSHGVSGEKIISISAIVRHATNGGIFPDFAASAGYTYYLSYDATNVQISLHATSSENILSKPFVITIIYEE